MSLVYPKVKVNFIYEFCVMMTEKQNNTDLRRTAYSTSVNNLSISWTKEPEKEFLSQFDSNTYKYFKILNSFFCELSANITSPFKLCVKYTCSLILIA
jgi:hypothetical protein